jgi:hypothetical protein
MLLRILVSPWTLVAVWIIGPAILIAIHRRNKARLEAKVASPAEVSRMAAASRNERESAETQVPEIRPDVIPGFRDLKWGDAPPPSMEVVSKNGDESVCTRHGELLRVEDVPVETINYIFSGGHFSAVRVDAPLHAADPLFRALSRRWGAPDTQDPKALKQQWVHLVSGPMATAAVLEKNPVSHRTTLFLFRKAEKRPGT